MDDTQGRPQLLFPSYVLDPGEVIRVYTNVVDPQWGGFSFGSRSAIWSNSSPNTAALFDSAGKLVSSMSYDPSDKPGCR